MLDKAWAQSGEASARRHYAGAAVNWVHHTGYYPDGTWTVDVAQYTVGGKAFVGYRFDDALAFEVAYHYLGRVSVDGLPYVAHEQSYAVSGSLVYVSPPLSQWLGPPWLPVHVMLRIGLAYKQIRQISPIETNDEGVLSGVVGAGFEFRPAPFVFVRLEYEFISTAIGGPPRPVPALNSLFNIEFGGTRRVVNVMNTPLAFTFGFNF